MSDKDERRLVEKYIDAVWDYFMEHSDLTAGGAFFVKFHTDNKRTFNKRVLARLNGYHRSDPVEKQKMGDQLRAKMDEAKDNKERWKELRKKKTWRNKLRSWLIKIVNKI